MTENINWNKVQQLLLKLVMNLASNKLEYKEVDVKIKLPAEMLEIFEYISSKGGDSVDELIAEYASSGITTQLNELIQESLQEVGIEKTVNKEQTLDVLKEMGIDTSGLQNTVNQLNDLTKNLEQTFGNLKEENE